MLPIVLDPAEITVGLAGRGEALEGRRLSLLQAGVTPLDVNPDHELDGLTLLYIAGLEESAAALLAARAGARGVLVNVEDMPALCDFHAPATVRRGDLLLTVSSAGRSPGLVRAVREWLSAHFSPVWGSRLEAVALRRSQWRKEGLPANEVSRKTRDLAAGWLA